MLSVMVTNRAPETVPCKATLVVCPMSTLFQWCEEIQNNVKEEANFSFHVYYGSGRTTSRKELEKYDVVLTTYGVICAEFQDTDILGRSRSLLGRIRWWRIVLDEAHVIKNPRSRTAKAAFDLISNRRWCLTGMLNTLISFLSN